MHASSALWVRMSMRVRDRVDKSTIPNVLRAVRGPFTLRGLARRPRAPPARRASSSSPQPAETSPAAPADPAPDVEQGLVRRTTSPRCCESRVPRPGAPPVAAAPTGRRVERQELDPVLRRGAGRSAKAAFEAGRYERAVQLLEGEGRRRRCATCARWPGCGWRPAPAQAAESRPLATELPAIADRCLLHAGLAREDARRARRGRAPLRRRCRRPRGCTPTRASGWRASSAARAIFPRRAAALEPLARGASPLWGRDVAAEALVAQADLARARQDGEAEREALLTLWSTTRARRSPRRPSGGSEGRAHRLAPPWPAPRRWSSCTATARAWRCCGRCSRS